MEGRLPSSLRVELVSGSFSSQQINRRYTCIYFKSQINNDARFRLKKSRGLNSIIPQLILLPRGHHFQVVISAMGKMKPTERLRSALLLERIAILNRKMQNPGCSVPGCSGSLPPFY